MKKPLSMHWAALAVLLLAYLLIVFHRVTIAMMADQLMEDLSLGPAQLGLLAAVYFYPYAFMQLPVGIMSDRFGPRRLVSLMLLLAALSTIAFSMARSFPAMLITRIAIGLSVSCVFVPAMKFIAIFFPASMFSTLASLFFFAGMVGLFAASLPLALLIESVGWRNGFLFMGFATALLALAGWLFIADLPKNEASRPKGGHSPEAPAPGFWESMKSVFRESGIWPIAIRNHLNYGAMMNFQSLWAGPFLITIIGVDRVEAGSLIMFLSLGGLVAPFSGYLSDHVFRSRKIPAIITTYGVVLFWIPFAFFTDSLTPGLVISLFLINGILNGLAQGAGQAQIKELYPESLAGTAIGLGNFVTMAGPAVVPVIIGTAMSVHTTGGLITADTFSVCFRYSLAASVIAAVAITFSKETYDASIFKKVKKTGDRAIY